MVLVMTKHEVALAYASWGWHVLPVLPNGKNPATQHGVNDATIDPVQIARWWTQNPEFNIGIAAGERSGLVVFDIDPRNGGDDSWSKWIRDNGATPDGLMQLTAGGGQHHIGIYEPGIRSCKLVEGVDLLSNGRYFVAYPSTIEGREYQWEASSDPFDGIVPFKIPTRWYNAYNSRRKPIDVTPSTTGGGLIHGSRNNGLTALGGAMRRYGMTESEIMAALAIANETRCEIPLPSSELSQIVKSVCRYDLESDIAASVSVGSEAADDILAASMAQKSEYFFTRGTAFLGQPSPLMWIIKGWIPDLGVSMVYGESGSGKTFITLDMACHIAAGLEWQGRRTRSGLVVYMAGEANFGMGRRIASWCKHNGVSNLDNLIISNKAIDIDSPTMAAQVIGAVKELTKDDAALIVIDTLNNHMGGDENSARDARNMLNSANIIGSALNAAICIVHHVGVSNNAQSRARGSSAWKASLDSQIMVTNNDGLIKISCTKMKDAEPPVAFHGRLERVDLGWIDEDDEAIVGAAFVVETDVPELKNKKDSKILAHAKTFDNAWCATDQETRDETPYVSRSALVDFLVEKMEISESSAKLYTQAGKQGRMIHDLILGEIIEKFEHGWIVTDKVLASSMMMRRSFS